MAGVKGTPQERDDADSTTARAVLGERGAIGDGTGVVAFAYCSRHPHVNVCDARNTHTDPMRIDDRRRGRIRWIDLIGGTSDAITSDPWDGTRSPFGAHRAVRAMLAGAFDARAQRERERINGRHERAQRAEDAAPAHSCPAERRDVTRSCDCDAMGRGVKHDHERDAIDAPRSPVPCSALHRDAYGVARPCATCRSNTDAYRATLARIVGRAS
jgi:hypothetical protein